MRHQPGGGQSAVDDLRRHGFLHQHFAAAADPLAAHVAVHEELRRHDIEPLAHVLAHAHHRLAALRSRAGGVLGLVVMLHAHQVVGQRLAFGLAARLGRWHRGDDARSLQRFELRLQARLVACCRLVEQLALLGVHGFGAGAKLPRLQPRQLKHDALELDVPELDGLRLAGNLLAHLGDVAQHVLGRSGQRVGAQSAQVLGLKFGHVEHVGIVQSQHRRGYPGRFGLPWQARAGRNCRRGTR